jgi:hypothetical protein
MRGKARSLAPIMRGRRKFPSVAGIDGMRKKTMIAVAVKDLLSLGRHVAAVRHHRFQRTRAA